MKMTNVLTSRFSKSEKILEKPDYQQTIIDYYSQAGMDYEPWSHDLNMHFGYFRLGINPFDREALLNEMTEQVASRLELSHSQPQNIIDLGCGVGASMRYLANQKLNLNLSGITIVPWQVHHGKAMSRFDENKDRIHFQLADYCQAPYQANSFDGAYAIESSCYGRGSDKYDFLKETYRLLKPGAKLVVADGLIKKKKTSRLFKYAHQQVCRGWSLESFANIEDFVDAMNTIGFKNVQVEEISWKILPSVLHVPWVTCKYLFTHLLTAKGDKHFQRLHFIAPIMGLLLGLHRNTYGYYLIRAER